MTATLPFPAIFLGDFVAERSCLLALVPVDALDGGAIRAVHLLVGEDADLTSSDSWLLQIGKIETGTFRNIAPETPLNGLLVANVVRTVPFLDPVLVPRGDLVAARLSPRGNPPPIVGLSLALEWGSHASRSARR